jgi:ADP-heptose:LPS heptosyltransferase
MKFKPEYLPEKAKILLIRLKSIGDVTLNTAVIPIIKDNYPDCSLDYLAMTPCDQIVRNNPNLNEILKFSKRGGWKGFIEWLGLLKRIRKNDYHLVIDMHGGPRSSLITALSGAKFKVGLARSRRARFYNVRVDPVFDRSVLAVEFQLRMIELLGLKIRSQTPQIFLLDEELHAVREKIQQVGVNPEKSFAVVHPGVDSIHNQWQPEKFAEIADTIQTKHDIQVLFDFAPSEASQVREVLKYMKTPARALQTTLREFAAATRQAKFLLTHNGGPMHMGAALGVPVFALFGPVAPDRWVPQVEPHLVFYKQLECSPCDLSSRKEECFKGDSECKRLISAEEVLAGIEKILGLDVVIPERSKTE